MLTMWVKWVVLAGMSSTEIAREVLGTVDIDSKVFVGYHIGS